MLDRGGLNAYEKALAALRADTREWWEEKVGAEDNGPDYEDDYDNEPAPRIGSPDSKVFQPTPCSRW